MFKVCVLALLYLAYLCRLVSFDTRPLLNKIELNMSSKYVDIAQLH